MTDSTCRAERCERAVFRYEVCDRHFATYTKPKPPVRTCLVRRCLRRRLEGSSELCPVHAYRWVTGRFMFDDVTLEEINSLVCDIDGCNTPTPTGRVCGTHQGRARKMYRLLKGAKSVPLNMEEIFERDDWICGICNLPTLREDLQGGYHPMMPVLDHIVARAAGGDSTPENVQTAHHACNSFKQDLDARELAFREEQTLQAMDLLGQWD